MRITLELIERRFDHWNDMLFNGDLPVPAFKISKKKRVFGSVYYNGKGSYYIEITSMFDLTLKEFDSVLVHEMIHYFIKYNRIKDTSAHGIIFTKIAQGFNDKFGLTTLDNTYYRISDGKEKKEKGFMIRIADGRYIAAVLPLSCRDKIKRLYSDAKEIHSFNAPYEITGALIHGRKRIKFTLISKKHYGELKKYNIS